MGFVSFGFLLFMLLTSNPFTRLAPVPVDGRDLNPLLQDPAMVAHPPMLYMGYVGFSSRLLRDCRADWRPSRCDLARWSRTVDHRSAWMFPDLRASRSEVYGLTTKLGWGGWWFWDRVENASFMPWLVAPSLHPFARCH
jgi:cytochrome c-type biogenesis protein CcmF